MQPEPTDNYTGSGDKEYVRDPFAARPAGDIAALQPEIACLPSCRKMAHCRRRRMWDSGSSK